MTSDFQYLTSFLSALFFTIIGIKGTVKLRLGKTPSFFHEVWRDHFLSGSVVFHLDKYQDHTKSPSPDVRMPHILQDPPPDMSDRGSLDDEDDHFRHRLLYKSCSKG